MAPVVVRWIGVAVAGAAPVLAVIRLRQHLATLDARAAAAAPAHGAWLRWHGPVVFLCMHEALAHLSFLLTGHRGLVSTGTYLKAVLDSKDAASHCALATTAPHRRLAWLHVGMLGWHCAKAADSLIISGYSPLRGLFVPNLIDTTSYSISAMLSAAAHPGWATGAATCYSVLRVGYDAIY